jgi:hypothetical protein
MTASDTTKAPAKPAAAAPAPAVTKKAAPKPVASKVSAKPAAKTAPKPSVKPVAKAVAKPVKAAAKPAAKAAAKPVAQPAAKPAKLKKPKMVRDSFTMPKAEFVVIDALKNRATQLKTAAKKTELIRAGIKALATMPDSAFLAAIAAVPSLKTGRPAKS